MAAPTITAGYSWSPGDLVTPTRLNAAVTGLKPQLARYDLLGRSTAGAGDWEKIASSADVFAFLAAADKAAMRTSLGVGGSNLNSDLAASVGVTLTAGSAGVDLVFNATDAPTVTLTAGTWLLIGSVAARTNDSADTLWAQFWNATDSAAFGGGAAQYTNLARADLGCTGVVTVTGSKVIYFKVFRAGASTLDLGSNTPSGPAGYINAVRLTT